MSKQQNVNKGKGNLGISLASLVITIVVIIILATIVIFNGLNTPDSASLAKFSSEFSDFDLALENDFALREGEYLAANKNRSKAQIYYEIASGVSLDVDPVVKPTGRVADLPGDLPQKFKGTEYYKITSDSNIKNWTSDKKYFSEDESHYVTDEGETFVLPGYRSEENGETIWWVNEKYSYKDSDRPDDGNTGEIVPDETKYIITLQGNNWTGEVKTIEVNEGEVYVLPQAEDYFTLPAKYLFDYWDVNGTKKMPGDSIEIMSDTNIKAIWVKNVVYYQIDFDANGGTGSMASVTQIEDGSYYTLPQNSFTAPANSEFDGWSVDGQRRLPGNDIIVESNILITPIWKSIELVVGQIGGSFEYNGSAITPEPVVTANGVTLVKGTDYDLVYDGNVNVGTNPGNVTVVFKGKYQGSQTVEFTITPRSVSNVSMSLDSSNLTYDGTEKKPVVTVTDGSLGTLSEGKDYTVAYENNTNAGTGTASVTITGINNYKETKSLTFDILNAEIEVEETNYTGMYDGAPHSAGVTVKTPATGATVYYKEGKALTEQNYWLEGNTTVPTRTDVGNSQIYYYVAAENYNGKVGSLSISISSKEINVKPKDTSKIYDGTALTSDEAELVSGTLAAGHKIGTVITNGSLKDVDSIENEISTITILDAQNNDVTGNYSITKSKGRLEVTPKSVTLTAVTTEFNYTGSPVKPVINVNGAVNGETINLGIATTPNQAIEHGTYSALVTIDSVKNGKVANYVITGDTTINFTITPKNISSVTMTLDITEYTFDGTAKTPAVTVTDPVLGGLTEGTHYTLDYENNTNASNETMKAKAIITGIENFTGTKSVEFNIAKGSMVVEENNTSETYDGTGHSATVSVTTPATGATIYYKEGTELTADDYDTVGSTTVPAMTDKGNYEIFYYVVADNYNDEKGSVNILVNAREITVKPKDATKKYDGTEFTSNEAEITSAIQLAEGHKIGTVKTTGSRKEVGTVENTIDSITILDVANNDVTSNYAITKVPGTLTVTAKDAVEFTVTLSEYTYEYDGTAKTPAVVSVKDGTEMVDAFQYTFSHSNNVDAGTATVTVTGIENYAGSTGSATFTINPKALTLTAGSNHKVYDGTALTEANVTYEGLIDGHVLSAYAEGSQINVGTSNNVVKTYSVKSGDTDVTKNYAINPVDGTLEVTVKTVTVTPDAVELNYTGSALKPTAIVSGAAAGETINLTITTIPESAIEPGTYSATVAIGSVTGENGSINNYLLSGTTTFDFTILARITFDVNGGSGSMSNEYVALNSSYTLPACIVTAPDGMEFEAYEVDGSIKNVGDVITITSNKEIKVIWKESIIAIQVGDYVAYDSDSSLDNSWRIWKIESDGDIKIISTTALGLLTFGVQGDQAATVEDFVTSIQQLENACDTFVCAELGITKNDITSMTRDDMEDPDVSALAQNKWGYSEYGKIREFTSGNFYMYYDSELERNVFVNPPLEASDTNKIKVFNDFYQFGSEEEIGWKSLNNTRFPSETYASLIGTNPGWLATQLVKSLEDDSRVDFDICAFNSVSITSQTICTSESGYGGEQYGVRPIITFDSSRFKLVETAGAATGGSVENAWIIEKVPGYVIQFDANGGEGEVGTVFVPEGTTYVLPDSPFTYEGYNFIGWSVNGGETQAVGTQITLTEDITLTAVWKSDKIIEVDGLGEVEVSDPNAELTYDPDTGELGGAVPPSGDEPETPEDIPEENLKEIEFGYGSFESSTTYTPGEYEVEEYEVTYTTPKYPVLYNIVIWVEWLVTKDVEGNITNTEHGDIQLADIRDQYSTYIVYDFETDRTVEIGEEVLGDSLEIWTIYDSSEDCLENAIYLAAYLNKIDGKTSRHIAQWDGTQYVAYDADEAISAVDIFVEIHTKIERKTVQITEPSSSTEYLYVPIGTLKAVEGMTWGKWLESDYNTTGEKEPTIKTKDFEDVSYSDVIVEGKEYGFIIYELSGVWQFNETFNFIGDEVDITEYINYTSNGVDYILMHIFYLKLTLPSGTVRLDSECNVSYGERDFVSGTNGYFGYAVADTVNKEDEEGGITYENKLTWYDYENESTIDFGSEPQKVSKEFYEWFTANATQQQQQELAPGLYETGTNTLVLSWDDLIANDVFTVSDGVLNPNTNQEILDGDIILPNDGSITSIGVEAFLYTGITGIKIPDTVTTIGDRAFYGCSNLRSIEIPDSVTDIGIAVFVDNTNLSDVKLSANISYLNMSAFRGCSSLTNIDFLENITGIGWSAFEGCIGLTDIIISEQITQIGNNAFKDCTNLSTVTLEVTTGWTENADPVEIDTTNPQAVAEYFKGGNDSWIR